MLTFAPASGYTSTKKPHQLLALSIQAPPRAPLRLLACSQKLDSQLSSEHTRLAASPRRGFVVSSLWIQSASTPREAVNNVRAARRSAVKQVKSKLDGFERLRQGALDIKQDLLPLLTKQLELCAKGQQSPIDLYAAAPASSQAQVPASASQSSYSPPAAATNSHRSNNSSSTSWSLCYPSSERIPPRFYVEPSEREQTLYAQATVLVADSLQWHVDHATRVLVVRGLCAVYTPPFQLHPLSCLDRHSYTKKNASSTLSWTLRSLCIARTRAINTVSRFGLSTTRSSCKYPSLKQLLRRHAQREKQLSNVGDMSMSSVASAF